MRTEHRQRPERQWVAHVLIVPLAEDGWVPSKVSRVAGDEQQGQGIPAM